MLKYLFTVEFVDGSILRQTQHDVSKLDPKRNQFYDVLNSEKLIKRIIYNEQKLWNPTKIEIDYQTGVIAVNGVRLYLEPIVDTKGKEVIVTKRTPVRSMQVEQSFNVTYQTKDGRQTKVDPLHETRIFYVGWETTVDGVTYRRVLGFE